MRHLQNVIILTLVFTFTALASTDVFKEIEKVDFDFGDYVFSDLSRTVAVPDGFVILTMESVYNSNSQALLKLNKGGKLVKKYAQRGNGPGELRYVNNIAATDTQILACELASPILHKYDSDLNFIKDYRLKSGGKVLVLNKDTIAIQAVHYIDPGSENSKANMMALYDTRDFEFKKTFFQVDEVPFLVQRWGGLIPAGHNAYAGVFPTEYGIRIFDKDFKQVKKLISKTPDYIVKYRPFKKNEQIIDEQAHEWLHSWTKVESIYYVDGYYILKYLYNKERYLDFIDKTGKIMYKQYKEKKNESICFVRENFVWYLRWQSKGDHKSYSLVKYKLKLK